jgi:DNA-binding PadR family transcriptional regulator
MSGYDLMREIEDKTEGAWSPGPGAVYPTLQRLAKRGFVKTRRRSGEGPAQISYEITPAGLRNIANAKKAMESSSKRMRMMSSLFIDLMEPDELVKLAQSSFEVPTGLVRTIVESDRSGLNDDDRLFVLRQYKLNLERELTHASASVSALEGKLRRGAKSKAKGESG